jgi:predicted amidohydrolase YtcJ
MTTTLFLNGTIRTLLDDRRTVDWLLVDGGRVAALGSKNDLPAADRSVDLDGGTVVPGFCDAHVHLPATGIYATGLDFRNERSARRIVAAFAERSRSAGEVLFGGNFEDPLDQPLSRHDLDAAVGDRPALLVRADMHSAIVSSALLHRLDIDGLEGVDRDGDGSPTGYLRERAAAEAWRLYESNLPRPELAAAVKTAVGLAYAKGVTAVHEMYVVEWRGWRSFEVVAEVSSSAALEITPYVATPDVEKVRALGLRRIGGDFFLDGSFGSHTAWLSAPYDPPPPAGSPAEGIAYRSDQELVEFFSLAQRGGLQTGVHAIGDAAIDQAVRGWETVAGEVGIKAVRALRHRIEHFECSSDDHIRRAAHLGLAASVQPAFDRFWGGRDGLYSRRMGWERASQMNRFRSMLKGGLRLGAGSDSTVTPLDPFLQMASLRNHHLWEERLDGLAALRAHTLGAHELATSEKGRGMLAPGQRADLAWLDRDPIATGADDLTTTEVLGTWIEGARVWPEPDAEAD